MERIQNDNAIGRRAGLALSLVAASGALLSKAAGATELSGKGMVKITALYGMPKDPEAFEKSLRRNSHADGLRRPGPSPYRAWQTDART